MDYTLLVVGLGNPGDEYEATRHNAGFMVVDELGSRHGASYWKSQAGALTAAVTIAGASVLLVKPQTFMNASGSAVAQLAKAAGLAPERIIVIHDELDIDEGTVRVKVGGGHAGHNGLRSIHAKLGSSAYTRVRVGTGRPPGRMLASDYVLAPLNKKAAEALALAVAAAADAVEDIVAHDGDATHAMNRYNVKN